MTTFIDTLNDAQKQLVARKRKVERPSYVRLRQVGDGTVVLDDRQLTEDDEAWLIVMSSTDKNGLLSRLQSTLDASYDPAQAELYAEFAESRVQSVARQLSNRNQRQLSRPAAEVAAHASLNGLLTSIDASQLDDDSDRIHDRISDSLFVDWYNAHSSSSASARAVVETWMSIVRSYL